MRNKNLNLDLASVKLQFKKLSKRFLRHAAFIAITAVLLVYVFVVWQISSLTSAEPSPEDEATALAETIIPKVNKEAVKHIQSLEQNSAKIQSLFNEARNNPFQE